jgi:hypothetical protein
LLGYPSINRKTPNPITELNYLPMNCRIVKVHEER